MWTRDKARITALVFMDVVLAVDFVHAPGVEENEAYEDVNGSLLGEPEAELKATDAHFIELIDQQDAESVGADEPDDQAANNKAQIGPPVRGAILRSHRQDFSLLLIVGTQSIRA